MVAQWHKTHTDRQTRRTRTAIIERCSCGVVFITWRNGGRTSAPSGVAKQCKVYTARTRHTARVYDVPDATAR